MAEQSLVLPMSIPGFSAEDQSVLSALVQKLQRKQVRNTLRSRYYDAKQTVRHLGIAIPPHLTSIETVIGWPAKAVDDLEQRIDLDGFVIPGASMSELGLDAIWDDNKLTLESSLAHASALKYAVTLVAVLAGDTSAGEPPVIIRALSATSSTALWDPVRRQVSAALSVTDTDVHGVAEFILYLADKVVTVRRDSGGWDVIESPNVLGRAPVAVLPFKPDLESPFGTSRISRAVMSITDRAVRSLLRMEVSAEFYSAPQRYVLGAPESAFQDAQGNTKTGWEVTLGKMLALSSEEGEDKPTVGQFPQMTMQPHVDMVRSDAALFSGETGIPVNSLGIIHDNPASEAAMQTAYLPLVKTAERAAIPFGIGWVDAMKMAVQVRDGLAEPPVELAGMRARFRNPATSTRTEAANATVQFLQAFPWAAESDVALEMFGVDQTDIERLTADRSKGQVRTLLGQLQPVVQAATADPQVASLAAERGNAG